ncbi:MAG: VWA domain-containing protein, partial [Pyrinomonadaceae bacterium]
MKSFIPTSCLSLLLAFVFATTAFGQTPSPTPDLNDIVKITTKLVQVDVVVTDKKGTTVRDLKVSDFEVTQDGKVQKIVGFSFVPVVASSSIESSVEERGKDKSTASTSVPVLPPSRIVPNSSSRIIAFLVDDGACGASVWGIDSAQQAIKRFIRDQMLPTDLVAIYRTRAGSSTFQQYTSDKTALLKAAEKIKWYPPQGACATTDGSFTEASKSNTFRKMNSEGGFETQTIESEEEKKIREYREDSINRNQVVGTLGVFKYAVSGLERSPGRKTMFVLSDGLALRDRKNRRTEAANVLRELTDAANRAGVVVHTLYLRGSSIPGMIESKDEVYVEDDFNATAP